MDKFLQDKLNTGSLEHNIVTPPVATTANSELSSEPVKARWLGRARRWEYLPIAIVCNFILHVLSKTEMTDPGIAIFSVIIGIVLIIESIRRLHDLGKSGWWIFLFIIPFVWLMTWCKGQDGPNEYGPDPRA